MGQESIFGEKKLIMFLILMNLKILLIIDSIYNELKLV